MSDSRDIVGARCTASRGGRGSPLIDVRSVEKTYNTKDGPIRSLRPISFDIDDGEFVVLVGPSGCGKSTLLKLMAGLLPASAGEISVAGQRVDAPAANVGIVFQNPVLLAWRSVFENVLLPIQIRHLPREKYRQRAHDLLKMSGLDGFERKYPWELSGGMQQRVSICRALVHDPRLLLMDEPFGALDAMTRERMNSDLLRIWAETRKTVFLITHSIPEAVFLADRVMVMSERPGVIRATYTIPLARPRSLRVMSDPTFVQMTQKIRAHFEVEGSVD
jgi:NitT/TauT family transport system ATP-binding protein